jgi:hypothetical protein
MLPDHDENRGRPKEQCKRLSCESGRVLVVVGVEGLNAREAFAREHSDTSCVCPAPRSSVRVSRRGRAPARARCRAPPSPTAADPLASARSCLDGGCDRHDVEVAGRGVARVHLENADGNEFAATFEQEEPPFARNGLPRTVGALGPAGARSTDRLHRDDRRREAAPSAFRPTPAQRRLREVVSERPTRPGAA